MILEVVDAHGVRARHRLDALPVTLGRALANDVILDDPYVDGRHARIARDETGALMIEDLGSVNGLVAEERRVLHALSLQPGAEVRVGRTVLRFRDPHEAVAPALVDDTLVRAPGRDVAPAVLDRDVTPIAPSVIERVVEPTPSGRVATIRRSESRTARVRRWARTTPGRLALAAVSLTALGTYSWLETYTRSTAGEVVAAIVGFGTVFAVWSGIWAVASRVSVQRFNFVGHFAVISVMALAGLALMTVESWLEFLFPDSFVVGGPGIAVGLVLLAALIAWHLSLSSSMSRLRRWRAGAIVAGVFVALGAVMALTEEETFTDVPTFSGVVKPLAAAWVPTTTVDEFGGVMRELKIEVDEKAAELAER